MSAAVQVRKTASRRPVNGDAQHTIALAPHAPARGAGFLRRHGFFGFDRLEPVVPAASANATASANARSR